MGFPIFLCRAQFPENMQFFAKFPEIRKIISLLGQKKKLFVCPFMTKMRRVGIGRFFLIFFFINNIMQTADV